MITVVVKSMTTRGNVEFSDIFSSILAELRNFQTSYPSNTKSSLVGFH